MTLEKDVSNAPDCLLVDGDSIRLVNNTFSQWFEEATLSTTGISDIEHKKEVGQVSTIMRALTNKNGILLSYFDKTDEFHAEFGLISLKHLLINNHDIAAKRGKVKGHQTLEHIFGFRKTF